MLFVAPPGSGCTQALLLGYRSSSNPGRELPSYTVVGWHCFEVYLKPCPCRCSTRLHFMLLGSLLKLVGLLM